MSTPSERMFESTILVLAWAMHEATQRKDPEARALLERARRLVLQYLSTSVDADEAGRTQ